MAAGAALFSRIQSLPLDVTGITAVMVTPARWTRRFAKPSVPDVTPPGTATLTDEAPLAIVALPDRLKSALPETLSAMPPPEKASTPVPDPDAP